MGRRYQTSQGGREVRPNSGLRNSSWPPSIAPPRGIGAFPICYIWTVARHETRGHQNPQPKAQGGGALLFVDVLGTKNAWKLHGRKGVERICEWFRTTLAGILAEKLKGRLSDGLIESDSAGFVFDDPGDAITVARELILSAFRAPKDAETPRRWLRGAILSGGGSRHMRRETPIGRTGNLRGADYSNELMEALNIEKSGYRGMRVIVDRNLLSKEVGDGFAVSLGEGRVDPLRRLKYSPYPERISDGYVDLLWMACGNAKEWEALSRQMANLLRWSGNDPEEMAHAAATQVVFNEWGAIMGSLLKRQAQGDNIRP